MAQSSFNSTISEIFGSKKSEPAKAAPAPTPAPEVKKSAPAPVAPVVEKKPAPVAEPVVEKPYTPAETTYRPVACTYLAPDTVIKGTMVCTGDVEICGVFQGDIASEGKVTVHSNFEGNIKAASLQMENCTLKGDIATTKEIYINEGSVVRGNISAGEMSCAGKIFGDSNVSGRANFAPSSHVEGSLVIGKLSVADGAVLEGSITMGKTK